MNHLASGGHLHNSCKIIFKATPVNTGIPFLVSKYPVYGYRYRGPPITLPEGLQKKLITGNMRAEAGYGKHGTAVNCTFV